MKELLINNGWIHYATGCACVGLPRYYKHQFFSGYKIIIKGGFGTIKKNGAELFKTRDVEQLKQKLEEYELITENKNLES